MDDAPADAGRLSEPVAFDEYKQQLRRLAMHDDALLEEIAVKGSSFDAAVIDERTQALARSPRRSPSMRRASSFQHVVTHALAVGATVDEIVATLEAVTPVTGAARVVQCAPKVALALGYDVDAALEQLDP